MPSHAPALAAVLTGAIAFTASSVHSDERPSGQSAPRSQAAHGVDIEVTGIVRTPAPGRSVAILTSYDRTRVVAVGETAFGARLVSVGVERITLEIEGERLEKPLARFAPPAPATPAPQVSHVDPYEPPEDPATPARDMDRRQVQIRLGEEMDRILAETALVPVTEDGRVVGVRLSRVAKGSLLTDAGLRAGDVLTRVNDTEIDGLASLIALWPRLQSATDLRAVVLRGGEPISLRVTLR